MSNQTKFSKLFKQLFPTGRVFKVSDGSNINRFISVVSDVLSGVDDDARAVLNSILPDNDEFTAEDATDWENRLGMISNPLVSLDDRKAAIIRKMNHPGDIKARQSHDYLQDSLQAAGFDLYVYENIPEQSPSDVLYPFSGTAQQGDGQQGDFEQGDVFSVYPDLFIEVQQGDIQQGSFQQGWFEYIKKVANHIDEPLDAFFDVGSNYRSTFFIGGPVLGEFADIDANRQDELRQLILKLKPVQTVSYMFINYI